MKYSRIIIGITFIALSSLIVSVSFAFTGPTLPAGQGGGTLQLDGSGNIGFGTNLATPTGDATNANFGRVFTIASTSDPGIALRNLSSGGGKYIIYSRANGRFVVWDDVAIRPRFFIEQNGNVGISGNSTSFFTPSSTLHVAGSVQTEGAFVGQLAPSSITGGAFQATNYAFPSALGVGTSSIAGLPTNGLFVAGNVGIGTKSPGAILEANRGTSSGIVSKFTGGGNGGVQISINDSSNTLGTGAAYRHRIGTIGGSESLAFYANGGDRIVIDNSGNVGIGTTVPSNRLTVGVSDASTVQASGGAVLNVFNSDSTVNNYASISFGQSGAGSNSFSRIGVQYKDRTGNSEDQDIFFSTIGAGAYAERMRISSTGNVGIGTASPTNRFHTAGAGSYPANLSEIPQYSHIRFQPRNDQGGSLYVTGNSDSSALILQGALDGTTARTISLNPYGGNVGIGTNTPAQKLSVAGVIESTTGGIKFPDGSIQLTAGGGGNSVGWSRTGTYVTLTTTTDWVAIGTTTPTQALHVQGNAYVSGNITTGGTMTTNVGASNVSAGTFGYTAGKGNYTFEAAASTNNVLKVDATNERVGVGITSPATSLHVKGTGWTDNIVGSSLLRLESTDAVGAGIAMKNTNGNYWNIYNGGASSWAGQGKLSFVYSDGVTAATGPKMVIDTSGNVGIGVTAPAYKLDLGTSNTMRAHSYYLTTGSIQSNGSSIRMQSNSDFTFDTPTSGTVVMTIKSAGNVGIGTTSPGSKLEIANEALNVDNVLLNIGDAVHTTNTKDSWIKLFGSQALNDKTFAVGNKYGDFAVNYLGTRATAPSAGTQIFTIQGSTGYVGIGTTTPASALHVVGDIRATGNIISGGTMTANVGAGNVSAGTFGITAGKGNYTFEAAASTNNVLKVDATNERVGVGESGPTTALDVKKDVPGASGTAPILLVGNKSGNWGNYAMIETRNVPDGRAVRFGSYLGSSSYAQGGFAVVTGVNGDIASTPTTKFFVRHDGNVGIGTSAPGEKLEVAGNMIVGTGTTGGYIYGGSSTNPYVRLSGDNGAYLNYGTSGFGVGNLNAWISIAGSTKVTIDNYGNVGIGTTAPQTRLNVLGDASGEVFRISSPRSYTTGNGPMMVFSELANGEQVAGIKGSFSTDGNGNYGKLEFLTRTTDALGIETKVTILHNGNVGIGTTTPAYKLHVNGTAKFENPIFVGSPGDSGHAATKGYVDSVLGSGGSGTSTASFATMYVSGTSTLAATTGKVIIGGAGPSLKLDVIGQGQFTDTLSATKYYDYNDPTYYIDPANTGTALKLGGSIQSDGSGTSYVLGNTLIGTTSNLGSYKFAVSGTSYFSNQVTVNANLLLGTSQNITLQTGNITGVNKITAAIIDPLYEIDGKKYATYGAAIAGGLYEEYIGRGNLQPTTYNLQQETIEKNSKSETLNSKQCQNSNTKIQNGLENSDFENCLEIRNSKLYNYTYVIDFEKMERGSDLWLWYNVVDFGEDTVQAIVTPIGESVNIYYEIKDKKIIFKTDDPQPTTYNDEGIKFSFRLSGKRHDWRDWDTYAKNQSETPSFILKSK